MMRRILLLLVAAGLLQACTEDIHTNNESEKPVVEAYLHAGRRLQMRVSQQVAAGSNDGGGGIAGLTIEVEGAGKTWLLTDAGEGRYLGPANEVVQSGHTYRLRFVHRDFSVSAETEVPTRPVGYTLSDTEISIPSGGMFGGGPPDPVEARWDNPARTYYVLGTISLESNPRRIFDEEDEEDDEDDPLQFANSPTQLDQADLNIMQFTYYGRHAIVLFHVQPEYAALFQNTGSAQTLRSPSTNVRNGYGIFTGVASDTLFLQVTE